MKLKLSFILFCFLIATYTFGKNIKKQIIITTNTTDLVITVTPDGRISQSYLGEKLKNKEEYKKLNNQTSKNEVYPCIGNNDFFEPALSVSHYDGNPTTILHYISDETKDITNNISETIICLKDSIYNLNVRLHYTAYYNENIIRTWSEIENNDKRPIILHKYASSTLYFNNQSYYLTQFNGDWANEVQMHTQKLEFGKKIIDTRLGTRAAMYAQPFFELGLDKSPDEHSGQVLLGTIAWTGNFRLTFDVDNNGKLRIISGINPELSEYELAEYKTFRTPDFIFTISNKGTGNASRDFQRWARLYQLKDGTKTRYTLLNNWESTYFNFNQQKLAQLINDTKDLGADLFLLDDGWFGNKYPRSSDNAGLGDWTETKSKLPDGIPYLVEKAKKAGINFGLWIEPEMVNPRSELFENHPDWVIHLPNRKCYYYRNQLVLDLTNPKVQDYVFSIIDNIKKKNPDLAFFKWDCNSPMSNAYSYYLKKKQSQLYIDYVRGFYTILNRIKTKYPNLKMMLCSGGGGRCDYEALKYFTEFWCSDNTDPIERLFIQWGYSHFFPAKAMCAHVTNWNTNASLKFRTQVAMSCKLGFDINWNKLDTNQKRYCRQAIATYNKIKPTIFEGDLYRLVSPYQTNHEAIAYISPNKNKAIIFSYDLYPRFGEKYPLVKLEGLDPSKSYEIKEINTIEGTRPSIRNGKILSGDFLMKVGINILSNNQLNSHIFELTAK